MSAMGKSSTADFIMKFVQDWIGPLEQLAQEIFLGPEFEKAVAANTTQEFLENEKLIKRALSKLRLDPKPGLKDSRYPVLYGLFDPLFELLFKKTDLLWGGINYWDEGANDFYTEQFTKFDPYQDDGVVFRNAMNWILSKSASQHLLPMTNFIFEKCNSPRETAKFYKADTTPSTSPSSTSSKTDFFDLLATVKLPEVANKQNIRKLLNSANADMDKILTNLSTTGSDASITFHQGGNNKLGEDQIRFLNLLRVFELVTPDPGWSTLYYISARLRPDYNVAGLLLTAEQDLDPALITFIQFFLSRISSFIEYVISSSEMKRHAVRSAIAAIMGRNMSHNIGSHVLARLSTPETVRAAVYGEEFLQEIEPYIQKESLTGQTDINAFEAASDDDTLAKEYVTTQIAEGSSRMAQLNSFLRMRMDFVADIATAQNPPPPMRLSFLGEVLMPFASQFLLWQNLGGSNNLTQNDITFRFAVDDSHKVLKAGKPGYSGNIDHQLAAMAVGIPNGAVGCQAFYCIIENFVRNTTKHSRRTGLNKLEVSISFDTKSEIKENEDLIKVTISDNWGALSSESNLLSRLNDKLLWEPLVRKDGSLLSSNRGLKEMKAAAAYLRELPPEVVNDFRYSPPSNKTRAAADPALPPPLLKAVNVNGNLGYELFLLKPKDLFVLVSDEEFSPEAITLLRKQGVEVTSSVEEAKRKAPTYAMLCVKGSSPEYAQMIQECSTDLPIRMIMQDQNQITASYGVWKVDRPFSEEMKRFTERVFDSLHRGDATSAVVCAREVWTKLICGDERVVLWVHENMARSEWNIEHLSRLVSGDEQPEKDSQIILYSRHGCRNRDKSNVVFYEPYSGGGVDPISFVLENPPQDEEARKALIYQLRESGALPILIIDERIQESAEAVKRGFSHDPTKGQHLNMIYWLSLMRVYVPAKEDIDLESKSLSLEQINGWIKGKCQQVLQSRVPPLLVIHQGILDAIGLQEAKKSQNWISALKDQFQVCEVIVTSGRGVPDNIPRRTRFIPLSTLALYAIERKSKFHLVQSLLASRRARKGGQKR